MLTKPTGPFASDGEIASKMEEWGDSLQARIAELEHALTILGLPDDDCNCYEGYQCVRCEALEILNR